MKSFLIGLVGVVALSAGCGTGEPVEVVEQVIGVACGNCVYEVEGTAGCPWYAEVNGQHYELMGPLPLDHATHAPDGICNMERQAKVVGEVRRGLYVASSFELIPAENIPEAPRFTTADHVESAAYQEANGIEPTEGAAPVLRAVEPGHEGHNH